MNKQMARTWAEIDLAALENNLRVAREKTGKKVMCVIKGDAHGHGAAECGAVLEAAGADAFGVAALSEAVELRQSGVTDITTVLTDGVYRLSGNVNAGANITVTGDATLCLCDFTLTAPAAGGDFITVEAGAKLTLCGGTAGTGTTGAGCRRWRIWYFSPARHPEPHSGGCWDAACADALNCPTGNRHFLFWISAAIAALSCIMHCVLCCKDHAASPPLLSATALIVAASFWIGP